MKNTRRFSLILVIYVLFSQSCSGSQKKKMDEDSAATAAVKTNLNYKFNDEPHRIDYEKANKLIQNFKDSIRFAINDRYFRVSSLEGKTIFIDSTFKQAFPGDTTFNHHGIRVHFGLNLKSKKLEYYLSPVLFESQVRIGQNNVDTLAFTPIDTAETSNDFDYLQSSVVYKVSDNGKLKEIVFGTADWQKMSEEWSNYKNSYVVGNPSNGVPVGFNSNCTRSIVITNQAIYNMIKDNKLTEINIISCANINQVNNEVRHSVLFSHTNLSEEEVNQLIKKGSLKNWMNDFETNWNEDINNKAVLIKKNINSFKDLTAQELMYLDLQLKNVSKKFFGLSADYAQLCPTRCGKLLGIYDTTEMTFTIKGLSK